MMKALAICLALVVSGPSAWAAGLISGPPAEAGCSSLLDCLRVGYELKSSTAVALTEANGDRRVLVNHYLQRKLVLIACHSTWYPAEKPKKLNELDVWLCSVVFDQ